MQRTEVDWLELPVAADNSLVLRVNAALDELAAEDPIKAEVVKLKFFIGLTSEEIASVLASTRRPCAPWDAPLDR